MKAKQAHERHMPNTAYLWYIRLFTSKAFEVVKM